MPARTGMWVQALRPEEKARVGAVCDRFIREVLQPRFLPSVFVSQFNYPIGFHGRWRGDKYSFITRYRSGQAENLGEEWDRPFARFDYREDLIGQTRFDVMWLRSNDRWWRVEAGVTLDEALRLMQTEEVLAPT